jgi:outer membrane usher protein
MAKRKVGMQVAAAAALVASSTSPSLGAAREAVGAAASVIEQNASPDAIFAAAFGRKMAPLPRQPYPLVVDGGAVGTVEAEPGDGAASLLFSRAQFIGALEAILLPEILARLSSAGTGGNLAPEDTAPSGVTVRFDRAAMALVAEVAPDSRRVRALSREIDVPDTQGEPQALVSGVVNVRAGVGWRTGREAESFREPVAVAFDGAVNIGGLVLEGDWFYDEGSRKSWQEDDARLVYDLLDQEIRLSAGDVEPPLIGYQTPICTGGVAAFRNRNLQPYRSTRPSTSQILDLDQRSTVQAYVNGVRVNNFTLPAGRYDLRDLPLSAGTTNDVRIVIEDQTGGRRELAFPAADSSSVANTLSAQGAGEIPCSASSLLRRLDLRKGATVLGSVKDTARRRRAGPP